MAARLAARQAQADLALTEADRRDAPALIVGLTRERDGFDTPSATTTRLGLRWPLAADVRNAPRAAAARAELAQAEGQADALLARLAAEAQAARAEHAQALQLRQLARAQAALAEQAQRLIRRAFDLGEADLPTRLAADAEHQQARLDARRAELEAGRAQSRLRQALGLLPGASATPAPASPATSAPRATRASSSEAAQP